MILSGKEIKKRLGKDIIIDNFKEENLNPNSYNVTLSNKLYVYTDNILDTKRPLQTTEIIIPEEGFVLEPNVLYIGSTNEYTETYNLVPRIEGRSSMGRLGISTHTSAGFGDVGYKGKWSIQLISLSHKVRIYPNMKIAQLYYEEIVGEFENYKGKYSNNSDSKISLINVDFKTTKRNKKNKDIKVS